ncbi:MAG: transposase [Chloroflexi bacterium]|nr:transposase [Chloroflexota bacterium]
MKQIYVQSYYRTGYSRFMQYINDILGHPSHDEIEKRIKIIEFFETYGAEPTREAFGKSRSTVYLWKQKLNRGKGKLSALASGNKAPIRRRHRTVHLFIENFIVEYRTAHQGADKTTITPALTVACQANGVRPVSESTVGRIISDLKAKGRLSRSNKLTLNGRTGRLVERVAKPRNKKTRRKGFVPQIPGDLVQMDTISIFTAGLKRYIFTAIDVRTRFAFACAYKSNSSANGSDFLDKFLEVAPFHTRRIQTDNGSEFAKHFNEYCQKNNLTHFFNYPKHPQSNAHLERFNRTIQEQFVNGYLDYLDEPAGFNPKLMEYLIWYNTEKPHRSINNLSPLRYYLDNFISPQKSNMLWTLTPSLRLTG